MRLIIVRHGEAEAFASSDEQRELTQRGINESHLMGKWLKQQNIDNDLVLVSPYIRAEQTYQAMLDVDYANKENVAVKELTPESDPFSAEIVIRAYGSKADNILVISHLPLVSYLVEKFTKETGPIFATAAAAVIELDDWQEIGDVVEFKAPFQLL